MHVITRQTARRQGLSRYFTGLACKHGHLDERLVSNGTCCACNRAKVTRWQRENPLKAAAKHAKWRDRHPNLAAQRANAWYYANKDRHAATMRAWFASIPHARAKLSAKARATRLQRTPRWLTEDDLWMLEQIYDLAKLRTQCTGVKWHVDHIIPLRGATVSGLHTPLNLRVVPAPINLRKGNTYAAC